MNVRGDLFVPRPSNAITLLALNSDSFLAVELWTTRMTAPDDSDRFFVLTGGPGAGKSAVIDALARAGHAHSREAGRAVIQDQVARGGRALPWIDPAAFAELMLEFELRSYREAQREHGLVFFDRGMSDIVGYLRLSGLTVPPHIDNAARTYRYNRRVFILAPWREIFRQDSERKQDFGEAVRTYETMIKIYGDYGYELIEVPRASVEERVRFILNRCSLSAATRSRM